MILRDADLSTDWDAEANALDARQYYCQNWRADVSVIIDDSATLVERVMYSPYGVPFGIPAGDVANSSFGVPEDGIVNGFDNSVLLGAYSGSWNYCDLDNDGDVDADDTAIVNANTGNNLGWGVMSNTHNRFGYAGYVFDENLAGTKWHVRHRVLESVLGRWISRDELQYVDGVSLYSYAACSPVGLTDSFGLCSSSACNLSTFLPQDIPAASPPPIRSCTTTPWTEVLQCPTVDDPCERYIRGIMSKANCSIPQVEHVNCEGCDEGIRGWYDLSKNTIYMCMNRIGAYCNCIGYQETLNEEFLHAADFCVLQLRDKSPGLSEQEFCLFQYCTEARACRWIDSECHHMPAGPQREQCILQCTLASMHPECISYVVQNGQIDPNVGAFCISIGFKLKNSPCD